MNANEVPRGSAWELHVGTYTSFLEHFDTSSDLKIEGFVGGGASADVYKGRLHLAAVRGDSHDCDRSGCKTVAIKRFRIFAVGWASNVKAVRSWI